MTTGHIFKLSALSLCLCSAYDASLAADTDVDALTKPDSSVSVGVGNWSGDRHQQGIYDGMRDKGAVGLMDADINKRDDETGTWLKLKASNLGLETREMKAEYLRQGDMGVSFEYSRTPSVNPNTFSTRLQGVGSTTEAVPSALGTNGDISLGTKRDLYGVGFTKRFNSEFDFVVNFKNEEKTGTRASGVGTGAYFAVEPINSTTRQLETTLNYTTKALQLSGGYYGSWYGNNVGNSSVTINYPTNATTYLSLPLDNQAHQAFLNGGYNFTPTTRGTFKAAYTYAAQNQALANQGWSAAPPSLNAVVNTTLLQMGLTSRLTKDLSVAANLRYHNVDDATPTSLVLNSGSNVANYMPWSYKTLTGKLEGTYRLPKGYSLTAGLDQNRQDRGIPSGFDTQRAVPYRQKVEETTYRVQLRRSMSETINGAIAYLYSDRTGSSYGSSAAGPTGTQSNLINPINVANRTRNKIRMLFDWTPIDDLTLQFTAENARDNYAFDHVYGVRDGNALHYNLDATYAVSDKWSLNSWYSYDRNRAHQLNTQLADALQSVDHSVGFGARGNASERLKFGGDIVWTRDTSTYQQAAAQPSTLEPITNILFRAKIFSQYMLNKHSEVRFDFIHERWKTNDWTWMFANGSAFVYGTSPNDGTMVSAMPKQISNYVGARYIYRFQ